MNIIFNFWTHLLKTTAEILISTRGPWNLGYRGYIDYTEFLGYRGYIDHRP